MATQYAQLKHLYSFTEGFQCLGKCQQYCGAVPFTPTEAKIAGVDEMHFDDALVCKSLTPLGTCAIYENRPLICRMFGAVDTPLLRCPHGCKPVLSELEGQNLAQLYQQLMEAERA